MNGEPCHDANLPFEPSMRRVINRMIAIIEAATISCIGCYFWQNEAKMLNLFKETATSVRRLTHNNPAAYLAKRPAPYLAREVTGFFATFRFRR